MVLNSFLHECTQCRINLNIAWGTYSSPSPSHSFLLQYEAIMEKRDKIAILFPALIAD